MCMLHVSIPLSVSCNYKINLFFLSKIDYKNIYFKQQSLQNKLGNKNNVTNNNHYYYLVIILIVYVISDK